MTFYNRKSNILNKNIGLRIIKPEQLKLLKKR